MTAADLRPDRAGAVRRREAPFDLPAVVEEIYLRALDRYGPAQGELLAMALLEEDAGIVLRHGLFLTAKGREARVSVPDAGVGGGPARRAEGARAWYPGSGGCGGDES